MESQITLTGYVGSDVEYVRGNGWVAARFRLGCTPHWRKGTEWVNGTTTWLSIRTSGLTADNVRDSVRKGDPMVVTGRLRTRGWDDSNNVHHEQLVVEAFALGHDMARGVSNYMRPAKASVQVFEDEPLGPSEEDLLNGAKPNPLEPPAESDMTVREAGQGTADEARGSADEAADLDELDGDDMEP